MTSNISTYNYKILFVGDYNTSENLSGPQKVGKRIFFQHCQKYKSIFLTYYQDGKKYSYFKKIFSKEEIDNINGNSVFRIGIFRAIALLHKYKPKIVHIITFERFGIIFYLLKLLYSYNLIYNVHGIIRYEETKYNHNKIILKYKNYIAEYFFINYSDKIFYLSEYSLKILKKFYDINLKKFIKITNGVDLIFTKNIHRKKNQLKDTLNIVFIGDITRKEKGFQNMLLGLKKVKINYILHVISNEFIQDKIQSYKNIIFYPRMETSKYFDFLKDKDLLIACSDYDNFPIVVLETFIAGLSIILSDTNGINEFLYGEDGVRVITNCVDELKDHIDSLDYKTHFYNRKKYFNKLSWKSVYINYEKLYSKLLKL